MLKSLHIKNYLIIDNIEINFNNGLTIITGETGSGKSIILDAFALLQGKRAETDILMDKSIKCVIEAVFNIEIEKYKHIFIENELEIYQETVIRREILTTGKSRAFINDSPVTLSILKTIGEELFDIHSQHENLGLKTPKYRMQIIDSASKTSLLSKNYQAKYQEYLDLEKDTLALADRLNKLEKEIEYYQYQAKEIESLEIENDKELAELENEASLLENASEIKEKLHLVLTNLDTSEYSAENLLKEAKHNIEKISSKYKQAQEIGNRISSILIEVRDITSHLENEAEKAETNPLLLEKYTDRINTIHKVLEKHRVSNISELIEKYTEFKSYIDNSESLEEQVRLQNILLEENFREITEIARELSKQRSISFESVENKILKILISLGIPKAKFKIDNSIQESPGIYGFDNINFLFSANTSIEVQAIEKVASGGEFSRLMLTLKSIISETRNTDTIIFDEIDTGVSGEISAKMGKIMKGMSSKNMQVISITHLPQVAAQGEYHYKVYKTEENNKTYTRVKFLSPEERTREIASMISGEELSPEAIENAKILLANN